MAALLELDLHIPKAHQDFINGLSRYVIASDFVAVHAGLDPYLPLVTQPDEVIYWIREPFINFSHTFEKTIIFGHTPQKAPLVDLPYKIGIDTGLVWGNRLTMLEFSSKQFYSVEQGASSVNSPYPNG